nr:DNA polymerase catalytic subunit [Monodontid alphaherpesvirus 2]
MATAVGAEDGRPDRRGFYNPFLHGPRAAAPDRARRDAGGAAQGGYCTRVSSFKFIAPRCLDEAAPPEARRGVHIGTLARPPRVYWGGEEGEILDFPRPLGWPRRTRVWAGRSHLPGDFDPRFETFHVYDIVESTERASARDASRFAALTRPVGCVVTLLGLANTGARVAVHVYGVRPYFFMEKAQADRLGGVRDERQLARALAAAVQRASIAHELGAPGSGGPGRRAGAPPPHATADCFDVGTVEGASVYYFDAPVQPFYRVRAPCARTARYVCDNFCPDVVKYEGNVDATTRFLLDNPGFVSFGWYRLRPGAGGERVAVRRPDQHATSCDVEVNCTAENLEPAADAAWPDYKLMSFDIECKAGAGNELAFPVATNPEDVVIQISCALYSLATGAHEHTLLFSLGSCDLPDRAVGGGDGRPAPVVLEFDSEFELLLAFMTFFKQYSPEFVTGYNIVNFDWPYICDRLTVIYDVRLDGYGKMNRGGWFRVSDAGQNRFQKQSKVKISGVVVLDMYCVATEKLKLPSYRLDAVAEAVLGERKADLSYKEIPAYFAAGPGERGVIGEYCIQDSTLVGKLFFRYLPHLELSAVARLASITLPRAIFDGQQIRVFTCLLRLARQRGFLLPGSTDRWAARAAEPAPAPGDEGGDEGGGADGDARAGRAPRAGAGAGRVVGYQGATVLDPAAGFHVDPVVVMDFASLYPSIIQAHNLCFTTLALEASAVARLRAGLDYSEFDVGGRRVFFVHAHVRESLLSVLLRDWLAMRKAIRARIPGSPPEEAVLLDKQQAAIKVVCNSVYGFTGVAHGLLPCLPVAATVTTIGRDMLLRTRQYLHERWATFARLEEDFPAARAARRPGVPYAVSVIYGDTDSVFVKCAGLTYDGVCALGEEMARHVSGALFRAPVKLECEKTFAKLLLITKKKYIGVVNGGKVLMKGVELVRKSNCRFINTYAQRLVDVLLHDDVVSNAAAEISSLPHTAWRERQLPPGFARFGQVLREAYARVCEPGLDVGEFVMTAELSRPPEAYANKRLMHLTVYHKLLLRDEARPSVKERIPYVIVEPTEAVVRDIAAVNRARGTPPAAKPARPLVSDMAEDPAYAVAHAIPLNTDYYFSHLLSTVGGTFKALFGNDARTTELLLKRFIPETRGVDAGLQARLARAGFRRLEPATPGEESRQTLRTAFCILAGAPRRS